MAKSIELEVNGKRYPISYPADTSLLSVLRDELGLTGSKYGCGEGQCGACTVLIGGVPRRSCTIPVSAGVGKPIITIEGLEKEGRLHPVQQAFLDAEAIQGSLVGALVVEVGFGGIEGFEQFLGRDLAGVPLVAAGARGHAGDTVVLVAVEPGLDGAPGELARVALLVEEGHGGDVADAFLACASRYGVDGAEDAHLEIDRRQLHEFSPVSRTEGGRRADDADETKGD